MAGVGQTGETAPRSGFIKFEFDKDWIGAKGYVPINLPFLAQSSSRDLLTCHREAELLHHYITSAAQNPPQPTSHFTNQNFQLGSGGGQSGNQAIAPPVSTDIAPDQSVSTASSGKVAGY
jgi:hypothetical protein